MEKRVRRSQKIYRHKKNMSRKNNAYHVNKGFAQKFQTEITTIFLEILLMVKLFHWKTTSYATHKATDELYSSLNENIDKFIEVLLGKTNSRIDLMNKNTIRLMDLNSQEVLREKIQHFKSYLINLDENVFLKQMSNSDLFNIRDEILGDMNKFLYLLTFK
jgi:hypothetical protein